jgi:hypothetical protein
MKKRYAGDFDPSTLVVELCKYSNAYERIKVLEDQLRLAGEQGSLKSSGDWVIDDAWFSKTDELLTDAS